MARSKFTSRTPGPYNGIRAHPRHPPAAVIQSLMAGHGPYGQESTSPIKDTKDNFILQLSIPDLFKMFHDDDEPAGFTVDRRSPPLRRHGLDWSIQVLACPYDHDNAGLNHAYSSFYPSPRHLSILLFCRRKNWTWSCEADYKITINDYVSMTDISKSYKGVFSSKPYKAYDGDWTFAAVFPYKLQREVEFFKYEITVQVEVSPGAWIHHNEDKLNLTKLTQSSSNDVGIHFLESGEGANLTIVSRDGEEFRVHRGVLAMRSEVFATNFETQMTEQKTGILSVKDMDGPSLRALLQFLYTGDMQVALAFQEKGGGDVNIPALEELINACEKYGFPHFKEYCGYLLAECCREENAVQLLSFARRFELTKTIVKNISMFVPSENPENLDSENKGDEQECGDGVAKSTLAPWAITECVSVKDKGDEGDMEVDKKDQEYIEEEDEEYEDGNEEYMDEEDEEYIEEDEEYIEEDEEYMEEDEEYMEEEDEEYVLDG